MTIQRQMGSGRQECMTRMTGVSRMTRIWTSWVTLSVVVAGLVGGGLALAWRLQRQAADAAEAGALGAGQLVAATAIAPGLMAPAEAKGTNGVLDTTAVSASLAGIMGGEGVSGVTVWLADGTVVFHRGSSGPHGPGDEAFRVAAAGGSQADFFTLNGTPSLQALLAFGAEPGQPAPLVVSVTMPSAMIVDLTTWATVKLLAAVAIAGIFAVIGVFALQRRLRYRNFQARHDTMTGLGNRAMLEGAAGRVLRQGPAALLLLDLDGFKRVNDHLGHATGDELLREVATAIAGGVRPDDALVRLGGDEFAVLLPDVTCADARAAAERLLSVVQRQFVVRGVTVEVDASIGVACTPPDTMTIGELLSAADVAMYRAKRDRLGVCTYEETGPDSDGHDLSLLVDLRRAIPAGELELHYQPAIAVRPGVGEFVEALVRWRHPERGLIPPDAFIPLAEETALIHPLTEWVLDEAARQCAQWRLDGLKVQVAVNVSPRSLAHAGLVETVVEVLARHQLPAEALHIEITESAIIARPNVARIVLERLQSIGVSISIDDFGAGYTSLAHLKTMPVGVIKIDRMFIRDLLTDQPDQAIVAAVIALGHRLGMTVVAEGVEDASTLDHLVAMGCDVAQGFHISRPHPAAETTRWLRDRSAACEAESLTG
jgi:diguanylate cyclase (GGDEF)-like protein